MKCQYLGNEIKYEVQIWYPEVIYDADIDYCTQIRMNEQKLVGFDDVIILETMKT